MNKLATNYAEKYGIIDFTVKGSRMVYYANFPGNRYEKHVTYKVIVDLANNQEKRIPLKRFYKKGNVNGAI